MLNAFLEGGEHVDFLKSFMKIVGLLDTVELWKQLDSTVLHSPQQSKGLWTSSVDYLASLSLGMSG